LNTGIIRFTLTYSSCFRFRASFAGFLRKEYALGFFPKSFSTGRNLVVELEAFTKDCFGHLGFSRETLLSEDLPFLDFA
jgi:hypothetical protein